MTPSFLIGFFERRDIKRELGRAKWRRSRWTWSTSLSIDTSGTQLQTQVHVEHQLGTQTAVPDQQKRSIPTSIVWVRGEIFKAESETTDLWQSKWNENQAVLVAAMHTSDGYAGSLAGAVAGSWSLGVVEQSQGECCCWLQRDGSRGWEGGDWWEMAVEESQAAMEARRYCWVTGRGWNHHHSLSLPTHQLPAAEQ